MKILSSTVLIFFFIILSFSSCVTRKKLTYIQYSDIPAFDARMPETLQEYRLLPYDILFVRVITPDPIWAELFNTAPATGGTLTEESARLIGYVVDSNGDIEIPFVGKLPAAGKTIEELKIDLDSTFRNYVNDAEITVRLINSSFSILGEVNSPGRYPMTKERMNLFEALAMASDLRDYSERQKIQLIRPSQYGPIVKEFSLLDRSILNSEFYYIMPNDIIYAQPMVGRNFFLNAPILTTALTSVTTILVLVTYFR